MTETTLSIDQVNSLTSDIFIKIFENIVEHHADAAIVILKYRPFRSVESICNAVSVYLDFLTDSEKITILQLHPDLSGKFLEKENLTEESYQEQKSAGLDKISQEDAIKLNDLNNKYRKKFDFPFVICARENKVLTILSSILARLQNNVDVEINIAIEEIKKISQLRIHALVKDE